MFWRLEGARENLEHFFILEDFRFRVNVNPQVAPSIRRATSQISNRYSAA